MTDDSRSHIHIHRPARRGFTITELLVVIGIMILLLAILVPALFAATGAGERAQSVDRLRQIAQWMQLYQSEYKGYIVPSRFDYNGAAYPGKAKSQDPDPAEQYVGTWTDILWTQYVDGYVFPQMRSVAGHDYEFDSPDEEFYDTVPDFDQNPFRSAALNSRGAFRRHPGYFAANDFFNADSSHPDFNGWWTMPQISKPDASLYVIDSFVMNAADLQTDPYAGEIIPDDPVAYNCGPGGQDPNCEVDFRYQGEALILFLDGHVKGESVFADLNELQTVRKVKVLDLNRR